MVLTYVLLMLRVIILMGDITVSVNLAIKEMGSTVPVSL